ncbi:MAG: DsrE family protein [bacterium]|nr:DsrE family protein [bacterium]
MERKVVVLVRQAGLGRTQPPDHEFGLGMFDRFLHAVEGQATRPRAICFYTEGVKLVCAGSPVVAGLQLLAGMGVRLAVCGTCLAYFGLSDRVAVGEVVGMNDIVGLLMEADHVITV